MNELKTYRTDPDKNSGWSFDIKLLQEIAKKSNEEGWSLDCEQIDTVLKALMNKFPDHAGHDSRNPEVEHLKQDCKNLVEINNNQAKIVDGLQAEIKELKIAISDNINHGYCPDQLKRALKGAE